MSSVLRRRSSHTVRSNAGAPVYSQTRSQGLSPQGAVRWETLGTRLSLSLDPCLTWAWIPYHVTCLVISRVISSISLVCSLLRNASAILLNSAKQAVSLFKTAGTHIIASPSKFSSILVIRTFPIYLFIYNNFICNNNRYKKAAIREELNPLVRWPPKNIYKAIKEIQIR